MNVTGNLPRHMRGWASMPRRQIGHLQERVSKWPFIEDRLQILMLQLIARAL